MIYNVPNAPVVDRNAETGGDRVLCRASLQGQMGIILNARCCQARRNNHLEMPGTGPNTVNDGLFSKRVQKKGSHKKHTKQVVH